MKNKSFAQNFEDIILWRSFKNIKNGFYIDVGANHPTFESVTKLFYDNGWTGVNIEPESQLFKLLSEERNKDINLQNAISKTEGVITFYESIHRGLHTTDLNSANELKKLNVDKSSYFVNSIKLSDVFDKYANERDVHFLKIDVEGAEKDVLESMNFNLFRPWVIVIEATKPLTQIDISFEWEHIILDSMYSLVYHDGLNKFYLSYERINLKENFMYPPNVFDSFEITKDSFFYPSLER